MLDGIIPEIESWGNVLMLLDATFAHHGRPFPGRKANNGERFQVLPHYNWRQADKEKGAAIKRWFPRAFDAAPPLPDRPAFVHLYAGLLALADWVGSDARAFAYRGELDPDYWPVATKIANKRMRDIGLDGSTRRLKAPVGFSLVSTHNTPNAAQRAVGDAPPHAPLVILEAETGSGKTEAALWRFAALKSAGAVDSLFFAVPTRAAARQLCARVNEAMALMFDEPPEAILAIPGMLRAGEHDGQRLAGWEVKWDDDAGRQRPERWAAEHATRFVASEVAVGTVDQAMLAALQIKHAHLRGAALARSLLVIDEVHASDAYMGRIQQELVRQHVALGGHAMLMSATLGSAARANWLGLPPPGLIEAYKTPYPAVWVSGETSPRSVQGAGRAKSVRVQTVPDWSGNAAAQLAVEAASKGARVLVIRNTVDRARETWEDACAARPDLVMMVTGLPALHHSRFAAEDRGLLDAAVEAALGKGAERKRGCIVIGTQTLEQSLDIDADLLITDLCPMDVLLQRIGRLHRHDVPRPSGFEEPQTVVLCPTDLDALTNRAENGLGVMEKDGALSGVYVDVCILSATLQQIKNEPVWHIPQMNRQLVEAATHGEVLDALAEANGWEKHRSVILGDTAAKAQVSGLALLNRNNPLPCVYPEDIAIRTRLGDQGAVIEIEGAPTGPFGQPIHRIALPPHWSDGLTGEENAVPEWQDGVLYFVIGNKRFKYDRSGLQREAIDKQN